MRIKENECQETLRNNPNFNIHMLTCWFSSKKPPFLLTLITFKGCNLTAIAEITSHGRSGTTRPVSVCPKQGMIGIVCCMRHQLINSILMSLMLPYLLLYLIMKTGKHKKNYFTRNASFRKSVKYYGHSESMKQI